jgi:hypothetical protein
MIKVKIFMAVTSIISVLCFNFNKLLDNILTLVCFVIYDEYIPVWGPYMRSCPVIVTHALVDGQTCTNKFQLILNWYWDFNLNAFTIDNINMLHPKSEVVIFGYINKYEKNGGKINRCEINLKNNIIDINNTTNDIVFGLINLLE